MSCHILLRSLLIQVHFRILIHRHLSHILAKHPEKRRQDRLLACANELRERFPEMHRRFLQVIVRDAREHMVHLVSTDAVDDVMHDPVVPVDGGELATDEVPLVVSVPRDVHLGVVQKRDDDGVAGEDEHRNQVVAEESQETVVGVVPVHEGVHPTKEHQ